MDGDRPRRSWPFALRPGGPQGSDVTVGAAKVPKQKADLSAELASSAKNARATSTLKSLGKPEQTPGVLRRQNSAASSGSCCSVSSLSRCSGRGRNADRPGANPTASGRAPLAGMVYTAQEDPLSAVAPNAAHSSNGGFDLGHEAVASTLKPGARGFAAAKRRSDSKSSAGPVAKQARIDGGPAPVLSYSQMRFLRFRCPLLDPPEAQAITVAFRDVGSKLRQVLDKYGTAIVTDVASPEECKALELKFVADLGDLVDLNAAKTAGAAALQSACAAGSDAKQWPLSSLGLLGPMERCQSRGLPQGRFAWAARLLPKVRSVYAALHGTKDLVSSCDNSFFAPPAHAKTTQARLIPHVDQNGHDIGHKDERGRLLGEWEVFQGLLYVWGSTMERASTTAVWPGSHKAVYQAIMKDKKVERDGRKGSHFTSLMAMSDREQASKLVAAWREKARRLPVPAGALVLWNSRTVHQGWRGGPRLAQPVCWEPRARRSDVARERKLRLAALGLPSTHWASLGLPHMLLAAEPTIDSPSVAKEEKGGWELPLRASLQPVPLVDGADVAEMWRRLQKIPWGKPLSLELAEMLERSIRQEFKQVL